MNQFILIIIALMSSAVVLGQRAELSFDDDVAKFKPIEEGEQIEHRFIYTNTGDVPLVISRYEVACSCTKAFFSKKPLAPGASDTLRVTFDSKGKMGWQYRKVRLFTNVSPVPAEVEIRVKVKTK